MTTIPIDDTSAVRHDGVVERKTFCGICEASCGLVATVGYTPFFFCLGLLDVVGAIVLWTVVRDPKMEPTEYAR